MTLIKTKSALWEAPFPECDWFDYVETVTINNQQATIIEFNLPTASKGIIKWIGQGLSNETFFSTTIWRVLVDNGPIRHYGNITQQISTIVLPTEVFIYLNRGVNIKLVAITTGLVNVTGRLKGWWWTDDMNNSN